MGRPVFYQRIHSQAASVQAKSLISHLTAEIRSRREVSAEEAHLIALDAYRFLVRGLMGRESGQVEMPCIDGQGTHADDCCNLSWTLTRWPQKRLNSPA
ncbi:MAG: hypothetical protein HPY52_04435 [Firmicutes bacterium]|nr:hypothetical protein [Bacillota bacterium]